MTTFRDVKGTKTDDFAFLVESVSQTLLPYFLTIAGIGVGFFATKMVTEDQSRNSLVNMGTGLTGAALVAFNTQRTSRNKEPFIIDEHRYEGTNNLPYNPKHGISEPNIPADELRYS